LEWNKTFKLLLLLLLLLLFEELNDLYSSPTIVQVIK
jgi:hypothetical protein